MKRYFLSALGISAGSIAIPFLLTVPDRLSLLLTVGLPLMAFVLAEGLSLQRSWHSEVDRLRQGWKSEFERLESRLSETQVVSRFANSEAAFEYLDGNVRRATYIANTRITAIPLSQPRIRDAQSALDGQILKAVIERGASCDLVVSADYIPDAHGMRDSVQEHPSAGLFRYGALQPAENQVLLNFIIFDYGVDTGEASEVLLWPPLSDDTDWSEKVLLVRSKLLVDAFRSYHRRTLQGCKEKGQAPSVPPGA